MRMIAYGVAADAVDDYMQIGETTSIESMKRFDQAVIDIFLWELLEDISRLLIVESCGFPGMLGSIDCKHWKWKNCPIA